LGRQAGRQRLTAPPGTDEANFGTERLRVDNDGTVSVPEEAVPGLTHVGGFTDADPEPTPVPAGYVLMAHPEGAACALGGESFTPDERGHVVVPGLMVEHLRAHGFDVVPDEPEDEAEPEPEPEPEPEGDDADEGGQPTEGSTEN
jgi:hypothetical protein